MDTVRRHMVSNQRHSVKERTYDLREVPIGDLERIRDLNRMCSGWVDEWDSSREAVRRLLDEFGQEYPRP